MIKRKELKDYPQYLRYEYGDVVVDKIGGKEIFRDYLVEKWAKNGKEEYYNALKRYFSNFERLDEKTDQEIYGDIHRLREKYLDSAFFTIIQRERIKQLRERSQKPFSKEIKDAFLDILFYDTPKQNRIYDTPIDRWDIFIERVLNTSLDLIILPDHYLMLPSLFHFLSLMEKEDREIIILLKDKSIYNEPTEEDLKFLNVDLPIKIVVYNFHGAGFDLGEFITKKDGPFCLNCVFIGIGENALLSLHGTPFSYFIGTYVKSPRVRIYTNIQPDRDDMIPYIFSYIPKGVLPAENFLGMERVKKTLFHFEKTKDKEDTALLPYYFNFYSTTFSPKGFYEFQIENEKTMIDVLKKRDKVLSHIIGKQIEKDAKYIKIYYDLKTLEPTLYPIGTDKRQNGVLVTGLLIKNMERFRIRPILSEDLNYGKVSPRVLMKEKIIGGKDLFYFNFLYFFTDKLIRDYNYIRHNRIYEKLENREFFLGYIYSQKDEFETFPLYNKGFFGYREDGIPIFGRRKLEGGKVNINGVEIVWEKDMVNPPVAGDFCIYTPFIENETLKDKDIDYTNFLYPVGEDRFNIIVVNNKIITIRDGSLFLPCIGVVLSFSKKSRYINRLKDALSMRERENGYYIIETVYSLKLKLDPPKEIYPEIWKKVVWAYGGASLLVDKGKNLVKTKKDAYLSFQEEGWYHPLSKQTQETQVQKWVRGPRNVIGITNKNEFFVMTFSGRTKESQGVNFDEAIRIIEKEIGDSKIAYALNLDGGSSVCLGFLYKGEFFELNYPAPSPYTPAGMVRPVNSMIIIERD